MDTRYLCKDERERVAYDKGYADAQSGGQRLRSDRVWDFRRRIEAVFGQNSGSFIITSYIGGWNDGCEDSGREPSD